MRRGGVLAAVLAAGLSIGACVVAGAPAGASGPAPEAAFTGGTVRPRVLRALGLERSLSPAPSALAAPVPTMTVHDPTGDALFPQGDITGAGVLQNSSAITFGMTVSSAVDPTTDANWLAGNGLASWFLDTNRNGLWEYQIIVADSIDGHFIGLVLDVNQNALCSATATYVPHSGYRATVANNCFPALTSVRFGSAVYYDTIADPNALIDFAPDNDLSPVTQVHAPSHVSGYWMLGADGHVYPFGAAAGFPGRVPGATAMAPRSDGKGYWVVDSTGHVFAYGSAGFFGGAPALRAGEIVSTISPTPNGGGYWLFTNRGRAFPFGNAHSYGDMSGVPLNGPIVASVATPTGHGYYMVGSDGGIFCFGDARFHGSTGNIRLNKPVVGIAPTPDGNGYWLVASDGGVFAFNAPFRGSMGGTHLNQAVDGLVAYGNGYLMGASDGGVFDFSNKAFAGSLANNPPSAPIIGLAAFST